MIAKAITVVGMLGTGVLALAAGCGRHHGRVLVVRDEGPREVVVAQPREEFIVYEDPPPVIYEAPPPRPSRTHVWIQGYFLYGGGQTVVIDGRHVHRGGQYVWVRGRYQQPPHRGARWHADAWAKTRSGWQYRPGHWK